MHAFRLLPVIFAFGFLVLTPAIRASDAQTSSATPSASSSPAAIHVASACEGNRSIAADIFRDSIVVHERANGQSTRHVTSLTGQRQQSADSLFLLLRGLGGAMILRCPNVESVSCRFEARLSQNRLECTNCSACSEDLDRMSLSTLHRFKALLRELNLFL